jgi:hypothetical protein
MRADAAIADNQPSVRQLYNRVQQVDGVRPHDPAQTGGVGQIDIAPPVAQRDCDRRRRHPVPEVEALLVHRRPDHLRILTIELHLHSRIGYDRWGEAHVLVRLLTRVRRQPPWLTEQQRRARRHAWLLGGGCRRRSSLGGGGCRERADDEAADGDSCAHV